MLIPFFPFTSTVRIRDRAVASSTCLISDKITISDNRAQVAEAVSQKSQVIYTVTGPRIVSLYSTYEARVSILESPDAVPTPVLVELSIISNGTTYYKSNLVSIQPSTSKLVPIKIGYLDPELQYNLTVVGLQELSGNTAASAKHLFEDFTSVQIQRKTRSVFVQTDKVIYKPGETIHFRVVVLDRHLRPLTNVTTSVNVLLFDSRRNVIKSWKGQQLIAKSNSLFSGNFTLSTEPVLGNWQFEVETENGGISNKIHSVAVEQYILPKFNVDVLLPPYATFNNSRITAQVKASYTYGKPVGSGQVVFTASQQGWSSSPAVSKNVELKDGVAFVEFDLVKDLALEGSWERQVSVVATVVEGLTGRRQNGTNTLTIYKHDYRLQLMPGAENYKPGFPFQVTILVTKQDGTPVVDERADALVVRHGFSYTHEGSIYSSAIPPSGLVTFIFNTPTNEQLNINGFEASYKDVTQWLSIPEKITSDSRTYLQLITDNPTTTGTPAAGAAYRNPYQIDSAQIGQRVQVRAESNRPFRTVNYQLVSKNQLLEYGQVINASPAPSNEAVITFIIPALAAPSSTLIAYIISEDERHELVADSIKITTKTVLNNHLNISLSNVTAEPGENATLNLATKSNSLVALRGVDQSVLLLRTDRDLDLKSVNDELQSFDSGSRYYYYGYSGYGGSYTTRVFNKAGLFVLTNGLIYSKSQTYHTTTPATISGFAGGAPLKLAQQEFAVGSSGVTAVAPPRVRTHFPETWLWEEVETTSDLTSLSKTVPDTLTSWIITGYSIHSEHGLGILEDPQKLTVVRPFFITLNVPYSAVKGEVLAIQVLVHNYLENESKVQVSLDNKRGQFRFVESVVEVGGGQEQTSSPSQENQVKGVVVAPSDVGTVTFIIVPSEFGTIELAVKAVTNFAGDALSRPLIVKPPGQLNVANKVTLVDHRNMTSSTTIKLEAAPFPSNRVVGADRVLLSIVSDILGPTISNLGDLLKMPYGCGEQNLVNFVPDIVILDYLTSTNALTPEIKAKAISYLESGYQRQLTYLHNDGSFSAFGRSDQHGSTWLTAFVVKSFYAAKRHITVDDHVITQGLDFLARQQRENGTFEEPGRVLHSGLQGGASEGVLALTAYTVITFIETAGHDGKNKTKYDHVVQKALDALTSDAALKSTDAYALALTAYALELAGHEKKNQFVSWLEEQAVSTTDGEFKYWENREPLPDTTTTTTIRPDVVRPPPRPTKPVSVEMTSYQLMTYLRQGKLGQSLPIVKWLLSKRNVEGGFISTQDTVVGLAALGQFATATSGDSDSLDLIIDVAYEGGNQSTVVNRGNSIVLQQFELPNTTREVELTVRGSGMALVQLTSSFYVEDLEGVQAFKVDVKVASPETKSIELTVCTAFNRNDKTTSNMAVVEVNLPTGFIFDTDKLDDLRRLDRVMRFDVDGSATQLNIYYDSLNNEPSCAKLNGNLIFRVSKQSPAFVRAYDYYDTTRVGQAIYEAPNVELCELKNPDDKENCV